MTKIVNIIRKIVTILQFAGFCAAGVGRVEMNNTEHDQKISHHRTTAELQETANQFVDFMLNSTKSILATQNLQPVVLPEIRRSFSKKIIAFESSGKAVLYNVSIVHGLETIERYGNASLSFARNLTHEIRNLEFQVAIKDIEIQSKFKIDLMNVGPTGHIVATSEYILFAVEFQIVSSIRENQKQNIKVEAKQNMSVEDDFDELKLVDFDIIEMTPFQLTLEGLWPFNYLLTKITTFTTKIFKPLVVKAIEVRLRELAEEAMIKLNTSPSYKGLLRLATEYL